MTEEQKEIMCKLETYCEHIEQEDLRVALWELLQEMNRTFPVVAE